jgi:hypothetical protein
MIRESKPAATGSRAGMANGGLVCAGEERGDEEKDDGGRGPCEFHHAAGLERESVGSPTSQPREARKRSPECMASTTMGSGNL